MTAITIAVTIVKFLRSRNLLSDVVRKFTTVPDLVTKNQ
jgi:hypothetical protein